MKEFPLIQNKIVEPLEDRGISVVGVDCEPSGTNPPQYIQRMGLTFPFAMDFESELLRRYRLPGDIFPLNVVLDRERKVVMVERDLDEVIAKLEALADTP